LSVARPPLGVFGSAAVRTLSDIPTLLWALIWGVERGDRDIRDGQGGDGEALST